MDSDQLSEKQIWEKNIAQIFLDKYNPRKHTDYHIQELKDPEDVICVDSNTKKILVVQTTILTNFEDDIPYMKGLKNRPVSPSTSTHVVSFNDVMNQLRIRLDEKYKSDLGDNAALVIYQASVLWEAREWKAVSEILHEEGFFHNKEHLYDSGVWIICTDTSTFPAGHDIVCINDVDLGSK